MSSHRTRSATLSLIAQFAPVISVLVALCVLVLLARPSL